MIFKLFVFLGLLAAPAGCAQGSLETAPSTALAETEPSRAAAESFTATAELYSTTASVVAQSATAPAQGETGLAPSALPSPVLCPLEPVKAPTLIPDAPGHLQLDRTTGLHVTGIAQEIDLETWRLKITGLADHPLELTYDELRCMPEMSDDPLLVCEGFFVDKAEWAGVSLAHVLSLAGIQAEAHELTMISADGFKVSISLADALRERNILAYRVDGQVLPALHGFPLRAVIPGINGNV